MNDVDGTEPIFLTMGALCHARGLTPLNRHPGAIKVRVDEHWTFWVNGSAGQVTVAGGLGLPRFNAYVEYNGWPAGIIGPAGGVLAAGEAANEDTFRAAILKALS